MARSYNAGEGSAGSRKAGNLESLVKKAFSGYEPYGEERRNKAEKMFKEAIAFAQVVDRFPELKPSFDYMPEKLASQIAGTVENKGADWEEWYNPDEGTSDYNSGSTDYDSTVDLANQYNTGYGRQLEDLQDDIKISWEKANSLNVELKEGMKEAAKNFDPNNLEAATKAYSKLAGIALEFRAASDAYYANIEDANNIAGRIKDIVKRQDALDRRTKAMEDNDDLYDGISEEDYEGPQDDSDGGRY